MRIESLHLKNFRNVEEQTYHFNPHFTVLIGINGKGKSTWLHALRVACGAYLLGIPDAPKRHINPDEIRRSDEKRQSNEPRLSILQRPVIVEAVGYFPESGETPITWRRRILKDKYVTTSSIEDIGQVKSLGSKKYNRMIQEKTDDLDLPLIAFFGTSRVHGAGRNRTSRTDRQIFKEGYHSWYEMRSNIFRYDSWLATRDLLVEENKEYPETEKAFWETIKTANPYIKSAAFRNNEIWLQVEMDGYKSDYLPLHLHSDGIISFTEMTAELAYRSIVLNGSKRQNAVKETSGIVLIDELDLHIHPSWQRHVVTDLKNAFPRIQFVATTHSPFIVQSLQSDELVNLDRYTDVDLNSLTVDEISTHVMGVEAAHSIDNFSQEKLSKSYLEILEKQPNSSSELQQLNEIESKLSDPAVRAFLQMQRLKKEISHP